MDGKEEFELPIEGGVSPKQATLDKLDTGYRNGRNN